MNLFQKQQKTSGYNSIPDAIADDETAAVSRRSSKTRIALVAGTMMMLVAGGAVWMQDESSSYTTTAEGLVIATEADPMLAAGGAVWMQDESSSYTTTAEEGLVVATEANPDYYRICRAPEICCSTDFGSDIPCCGQPGDSNKRVPTRFQHCPQSRPVCEKYIKDIRLGHCVEDKCVLCGDNKNNCCHNYAPGGWNFHCPGCGSSF